MVLDSKDSSQYTVGILYALKESTVGRAIYTFLNRKWFFDKVYNDWVAAPLLSVAYTHTYQNRDRGLLEFFGPQGLATEIYSRSRSRSSLPLGFLFRRLFLRFFALTIILAFAGAWPTFFT